MLHMRDPQREVRLRRRLSRTIDTSPRNAGPIPYVHCPVRPSHESAGRAMAFASPGRHGVVLNALPLPRRRGGASGLQAARKCPRRHRHHVAITLLSSRAGNNTAKVIHNPPTRTSNSRHFVSMACGPPRSRSCSAAPQPNTQPSREPPRAPVHGAHGRRMTSTKAYLCLLLCG